MRDNMRMKKVLSILLCLCMVLSCVPLDVFATEGDKTVLDITKGDITINADSVSGYATDGTALTIHDPNGYIIQGNGTATGNVISVTGGTHSIELNRVRIGSDAKHTNGRSPLTIAANATVTLNLVGENTLGEGWDDYHTVNIVVGDGATLNIDGSGSLKCSENGGHAKIQLGSGSKVNINSGTVDLRTSDGAPCVSAAAAADFVVAGGTVRLRVEDSWGSPSAIFSDKVNVTLTQGVIEIYENIGRAGFGSNNLCVSGGKLHSGLEFQLNPTALNFTGGVINVAGGVADALKNDTSAWNGMLYEAGNLAVYGNQTLSENFEVASGKTLTVSSGASLTVSEGVTLTNNGTIQNNGTITNNGSVVLGPNGTVSGTISGNPEAYQGASGSIDVSTLTSDLMITDTGYSMNGKTYLYEGDYTLTGTTFHGVIFEAGEYQLTANNLKIVKGDYYTGSAIELRDGAKLHLVLAEESVNTLTGGWEGSGIRVNEGTSLTISGNGTLHAGYQSGTNGGYGAAIGGYCDSNFGTITINGGTIYASGTSGASIGSGSLYGSNNKMAGTIVLNGGTVYADLIGNAASSGAVLKGSGATVYCDSVQTDTSEFNAIVYSKNGTSATVYGNVTLTDDFEVPSSGLTVKEGAVLTVPERKTLTVAENREILCQGAIVNNGTIAGAGTVDNRLAQDNITGNGIVEGTVSVKPVCNHSYGPWETTDQNVHKKTCQNGCGKILTENHTVENCVCTVCGKELTWRYDQTEKTLYIYADLTSEQMRNIRVSGIEHIVIAEGVTSVPDDAFYGLYREEVKSVHIPESLETVGRNAFSIYSSGNIVTVFYCPEDLKDTVKNNSGGGIGGGMYGGAKVYVSYKMDNGAAKITAVEVSDSTQIDDTAVLDTVLYGKNVFFADGTLIHFPNTTHVHRGTQWTNNGDGNCTGLCVVCGKSNVTRSHDYSDAVLDVADNTKHAWICKCCGDSQKEAHSYTYTASGNRISAVCSCGHTGSLVINEINPQTYTGNKVQVTLNGSIDGVTPVITYCCEDGCVNAGTHTAKVVLGNAEATMQFEILKAEPEIGAVTAGVVNNTLETSAIVLTRANTNVAGNLIVDAGQTLVLGENEIAYTFVPTDSNYKTVTGTVTVIVADTIAPTGTVTIATSNWTNFLNNITFGLFFKETQTVSIVATDNLSGVAKIEYIESKTAMDLDAVKAATQWTEMGSGSIGVTLEDTKQFVYYIRITDKSGNVSYLSSDGAEYDTSAPVIAGVNNGATYYTSQTVTVTDKNINTVTLNGEPATGSITLEGDKEATYTIVATDKAGNSTTVIVKMAPIADITDSMEGMTSDNVTSDDKAALQIIVDTVTELLKDEELPTEEKEALEKVKADAEALLKVIEDADKAADTENTGKVEDITADNVTPDDKSDLKKAKADLEKALEDNGGNYTEDEKKAIEDELKRIDDALKVIENVEAVEDAISDLPATVEPDDEETVAKIEAAKKSHNELTDYEKSLVDPETKEKLDKLTNGIVAYDIVKGDGSSWTKGTDGSITFTVNGPISKFSGIKIDGKAVDAQHYDVKAGSTIITLKASYLETLAAGEHSITVVYTDGETSGTFDVQAKSTTPATGDNSHLMLWFSLMIVSCAAILILLNHKRFFSYGGKYSK